MFRFLLERLSWGVAFTVAIAFFLPWVKSRSPANHLNGGGEEAKRNLVEQADLSWWQTYFTLRPNEIDDALADPLGGNSGFSLLLLARSNQPADQERAQKMIAILGSTETREAAVFIYAVPACALLSACFFSVAMAGRLIFLLPFGLSAGLYALLRARLSDTYFDRAVLDQAVGLGLWVAIYGLLLMALLLLFRLLLGPGSK